MDGEISRTTARQTETNTRPSRIVFGRLVRRLDRTSFARFVADLWDARGWEATRRNDVVVTTNRRTGEHRTLLPVHHTGVLSRLWRRDPTPVTTDIDVVVSVEGGSRGRILATEMDADLIDTSTLYDMVVYAIDEESRTRLCEDYFGRSTFSRNPVDSVHAIRYDDIRWYRAIGFGARATLASRHARSLIGLAIILMALLAWTLVPQPSHVALDSGADQIRDTESAVDRPSITVQPIERSAESGPQSLGFLIVNSTGSEPLWPVGTAPTDDWPTLGFDIARTGYARDASGPTGPVVASANRSLDTLIIGSPVVVDGSVYIAGYNGTVVALNARSLSVEWRSTIGRRILSTPTVANGVVYVGTAGGSESNHNRSATRTERTVYAMSASTGRVRWRAVGGPIVRSSPAVVNGTVYVVNDFGDVRAIDAVTGGELWNASIGGHVRSSIAFANGTVFISGLGGTVYAFTADDGKELWNRSVQGPLSSSPAVSNDTLYLGTGTGHVHAFDAMTGAERWTQPINGTIRLSPALANGTVYIVNETGGVYAINATTGAERWDQPVNGSSSTAPAVANGTVYVETQTGNAYSGEFEDRLYALETETGAVSWLFAMDGAVSASPVIAGDTLYVADYYGQVYQLTNCRSVESSNQSITDEKTECR